MAVSSPVRDGKLVAAEVLECQSVSRDIPPEFPGNLFAELDYVGLFTAFRGEFFR
jgi:hypothetical protein